MCDLKLSQSWLLVGKIRIIVPIIQGIWEDKMKQGVRSASTLHPQMAPLASPFLPCGQAPEVSLALGAFSLLPLLPFSQASFHLFFPLISVH